MRDPRSLAGAPRRRWSVKRLARTGVCGRGKQAADQPDWVVWRQRRGIACILAGKKQAFVQTPPADRAMPTKIVSYLFNRDRPIRQQPKTTAVACFTSGVQLLSNDIDCGPSSGRSTDRANVSENGLRGPDARRVRREQHRLSVAARGNLESCRDDRDSAAVRAGGLNECFWNRRVFSCVVGTNFAE